MVKKEEVRKNKFVKNEKVVFLPNYQNDYGLIYNKLYIVEDVFSFDCVKIKDYWYDSSFFVSLTELRKIKIQKLESDKKLT